MGGLQIVGMFAATLLAYTTSGVIKKLYSRRFGNIKAAKYIYNSITSVVSALVLCIWGGIGSISTFTLLLGCAFGVVTAIQQITNLKALEIGPLSYTSVIISLSTLIPTLSGALIWDENIVWNQVLGIVLMMLCFVLSVEKKSGEGKMSFSWLLYSLAAFLCTGMIGVMQKVRGKSDYPDEINGFLIVAFAVSFVYSVTSALVISKKEKAKDDTQTEQNKTDRSVIKYVFLIALAGVCVAANNKLNLFLADALDSAVFYPIVNGGGLVLMSICAIAFFKEKLSLKQWCGLLIGIISVVLLAIK